MSTTKIALVFPGQGSQIVGMGKDFFANFKESALIFEEASDHINLNLKKLCFEGPSDELTLTENLQPALFTLEAAMFAAVRAHCGIEPVVCAGHSLGEYSALHAAGSLSVAEGVKLTRARGQAMQQAVPAGVGTMAAVLGLDNSKIEAICARAREISGETVEPANFNAPGQVVIAGTVDAIKAVTTLVSDSVEFKGARALALAVSAPFHCSLMAPAKKAMAPLIESTTFLRPNCFVIPNVTAQPINIEHQFRMLLIEQITRPVLWEQSMLQLKGLEVTRVIEIGPGRVLSGLHKRIDRTMPVASISEVAQLKEVMA